jgi:hypothetical protein
MSPNWRRILGPSEAVRSCLRVRPDERSQLGVALRRHHAGRRRAEFHSLRRTGSLLLGCPATRAPRGHISGPGPGAVRGDRLPHGIGDQRGPKEALNARSASTARAGVKRRKPRSGRAPGASCSPRSVAGPPAAGRAYQSACRYAAAVPVALQSDTFLQESVSTAKDPTCVSAPVANQRRGHSQ